MQKLTYKTQLRYENNSVSCRAENTEGTGGATAPSLQFLSDQLSLLQSGGADYAHHMTSCPPPPGLPTALLQE